MSEGVEEGPFDKGLQGLKDTFLRGRKNHFLESSTARKARGYDHPGFFKGTVFESGRGVSG